MTHNYKTLMLLDIGYSASALTDYATKFGMTIAVAVESMFESHFRVD